MPINIAARRFAKAQKRKAAVAEKRKTELAANSPEALIRRAASAPIQHCLLSEALFDIGIGVLAVSRGETRHGVTMVTFLLDTFGLGVKDVFVRVLEGESLDWALERLGVTSPVKTVDPSYARKLVRDLTAWADVRGVKPHRDLARLERIFGSVDAASCAAEFVFGYEGKPLFVGDMPDIMARLRRPGDIAAGRLEFLSPV